MQDVVMPVWVLYASLAAAGGLALLLYMLVARWWCHTIFRKAGIKWSEFYDHPGPFFSTVAGLLWPVTLTPCLLAWLFLWSLAPKE